MPRLSKAGRFAVSSFLIFSAIPAFAQRIVFSEGNSARVETRAAARSTGAVTIRLQLPRLDVDRADDGFDRVVAPGLVPFVTAGNPELASSGVLLAVPAGHEPELSIVRHEQRFVDNVLVRPAQKRFRCGGNREEFVFNSALYRSNETFPAAPVSLEEVGHLQGVRLVRVALNPLRQDVSARRLDVSTELVAEVSFRKVSEAKPVVLPPSLLELVRSATANSSFLRKATGGEKMLVVVADSLKTTIQPLVDWKRAKGLQVDVVTVTAAGGTKDKIKTYIQKYYDAATPKPSFLLMVGNKTTAPGFMESTGSGSAATDWKYALLAGTDDIPDLTYGRILADNVNEAKVQIDKWVNYERAPEFGNFYPNGVTIASNEGSNPSDKEYAEQVQEALKAGTYASVDGFYQGEQTATAANITGAVNTGRTWIAYWGHGSGTSWGSTNDTFSNTTVGTLTNGARLPIVIDVACQNGSWVNLSKCFGKAWMTQKDGGAVGYLGGSVNVSWHPPAVMAVGIAKAHFEKPVHTLGGSVLAGQLYLIEKMGTGNDTMDNLKWYNLFGDPSMLVRTAVPAVYDVKHQVRSGGTRVEIAVNAADSEGKGISGLLASLVSPSGESIAIGKTDADGNATLSAEGMSQVEPDTTLTVTGYNAETKQIAL